MNYKDINDYELLDYIAENNEDAEDMIFKKYDPLINSLAKSMHNPNTGLDKNDLIQEGRIGLHKAIDNFDSAEEASFYTFARLCIERQMINALRLSTANKHQALNDYMPIDHASFLEDKIFETETTTDPEKIMMEAENYNDVVRKAKKVLTTLEQKVFELKLSGFKIKEIADFLEKDEKSIENKLKKELNI